MFKTVLILSFFSVLSYANSSILIGNNSNAIKIPPLSIWNIPIPSGKPIYEDISTKNRFKTPSDSCIDLAFDTIKILKIEEKYIEIEFSIINRGTIPAPLFGSTRSKEDNVAVHFYFSGTNRLTRGAVFADGIYLTKGLKETKGMLEPKAIYSETIKLPLKKRISIYGVIILQLDAFDILREECDETNNAKAIVPKWY
jgi:hypothetical protein